MATSDNAGNPLEGTKVLGERTVNLGIGIVMQADFVDCMMSRNAGDNFLLHDVRPKPAGPQPYRRVERPGVQGRQKLGLVVNLIGERGDAATDAVHRMRVAASRYGKSQ